MKYFKAVTGRELTPGIIAVIQSFGNRINLHLHLHFLVSEGGSDREGLSAEFPVLMMIFYESSSPGRYSLCFFASS